MALGGDGQAQDPGHLHLELGARIERGGHDVLEGLGVHEAAYCADDGAVAFPFVNWYLKRKAGKPANFMERKRNSTIVGAVRGLVNTETFEHIVGVVLNKRSKLKLKMPNAFKKGGSSIPRRNWGKVTIVS